MAGAACTVGGLTCIVGIAHAGRVYIGGDSAATSDWSLTIRRDPKVFVRGEFVIGFTTSFRMGQIIGYQFLPPKRSEGVDLFAYMTTAFVDTLRDCLKSGGFAERHNEAEKGGVFLVGVAGRLFKIDSDYQVAETIDDFDACGAGWQIALGALYATQGELPADRIRIALEAAEHMNAAVRGPFKMEVL